MEIYNAIDLVQPIDKGGSTYPWLVDLLSNQQTRVTYVVKMFTHKQIEQQNAVAKEVYGNLLASALGLPVPHAVLVKFTPEFVATLDNKAKQQNEKCHGGLRFATLHHEGYIIFGDQLTKSKIREYDMASVYAFDNLVWNLDRGGERHKPNLLINDDNYLLIDHELIFPLANDPENPNEFIIPGFLRSEWSYNYSKHLFYPYLKKVKPVQKAEMFTPFINALQRLDSDILHDAAQFLRQNGHPCGDIEWISDYLCTIKENPEIFLNILQHQLS